jgi:integrase
VQVFTDTMIRGARAPASGRLELTDASCKGLTLRVTEGGVKTFAYVYWSKVQGKKQIITIGRYPDIKLATARARADKMRAEVQAGRDPEPEKIEQRRVAGVTFDKIAAEYIEQYAKPNKSSWKNDEGYLKRPRAKWGARPAASITDDDVAALLENIARTAPVSANRTQSVLHTLFVWAKQAPRKYVKVNPVADMPRKARETAKDRVLSDAEVKTLWHGLDRPDLPAERSIALALKLILATMTRPGMVTEMTVAELHNINSDQPEWHLPADRMKTRKPFICPLSGLAVQIIREALVEDGQEAVFASRFNGREAVSRHALSQALVGKVGNGARPGIIRFLGMASFTPHDLRRTASTVARRAGVPRENVRAQLAHTASDVTAVYDQYDMLPEKRACIETLEQELRRITGA